MTLRKVLRCKIHRAKVTQADLDYNGSITIPKELLEAAGIAEYEAVCVWNVTSGTRLETYAITGKEGSSDICMNGAAAHLTKPGEIVIISAFQFIPEEKLEGYKPTVVLIKDENKIDKVIDY